MRWSATSSRATGRGTGHAECPSAATLRLLREADATMSPGERDEYAGLLPPEATPAPARHSSEAPVS